MRSIRLLLVLMLSLYSSMALALGLGNIRVLSKPGQPLVAEIPVIAGDPGELDNAKVGLASAATFERVGLPAPSGLVSELQFQITQDAQGRAVVRVTSAAPVQAPVVDFLIEVEWAQGRLVREYTALLATPETATALDEPVIEAPQAAPEDKIARGSEAAATVEPPPAQAPETATAAPTQQPAQAAQPPAAQPSRSTRAAVGADGALPAVQRGQTLSQIARSLAQDNGYTLDQTMIALLRANPKAFIGGNINLIREGAVLRVPAQDELTQISAAQARAIVHEHIAQWRQARAPIPQPAVAGAAASSAHAANKAATDAHLEIAPAVANTQQTAGTTTGLQAGGEGDMAGDEQLRQTREDLAARDAELQETKERVAALEKLNQQQRTLMAMKDSDLAAAQQRLAEAAKKESAVSSTWIWAGAVVVVVALMLWALSRRRKPSPLPPASRMGRGSPMPVAEEEDEDDADTDAKNEDGPALEKQAVAPVAEPQTPFWSSQPGQASRTPAPAPAPRPARAEQSEPLLLFGELHESAGKLESAGKPEPPSPRLQPLQPRPQPQLQSQPPQSPRPQPQMPLSPEPLPVASQKNAGQADDMTRVAPLNAAPAGRERLELAIAYLDLGDAETARTLLNEVASGKDPQARSEALELLARLG